MPFIYNIQHNNKLVYSGMTTDKSEAYRYYRGRFGLPFHANLFSYIRQVGIENIQIVFSLEIAEEDVHSEFKAHCVKNQERYIRSAIYTCYDIQDKSINPPAYEKFLPPAYSVRVIPSIKCPCGGHYIDNKARHFRTQRHKRYEARFPAQTRDSAPIEAPAPPTDCAPPRVSAPIEAPAPIRAPVQPRVPAQTRPSIPPRIFVLPIDRYQSRPSIPLRDYARLKDSVPVLPRRPRTRREIEDCLALLVSLLAFGCIYSMI